VGITEDRRLGICDSVSLIFMGTKRPRVRLDVDERTDLTAASRSPRDWIVRATFEATLILFGLIGAFLVEERRETRHRQARVHGALTAIRAELEVNQQELARAIANHDEVIAMLKESAKTGVVYEKGIIAPRFFSAAAWEAARNAAITSDIDHPTLLTLGRAYSMLADYVEDRSTFLNHLYTNNVTEARRNPLGLAGWLSDMVGRARRVDAQVGQALEALPR
jgi:hypothetical protein